MSEIRLDTAGPILDPFDAGGIAASWKTAIVSWLLWPVYVWQGLKTRKRVMRMPPPKGHLSGLVGASSIKDAAVRLLVIGDSSAAGVGVDHIDDALGPRLADRIHAATGRSVFWKMAGSNSAVCADVRDHVVPNIARDAFTHIVLMIGSNDAKNFHGARRFKKAFGTLLYALRARWPEARIVWSPPVDMKRVPALPRSLAHVLELRARIIRRVGAVLCFERGAIVSTTLPRVEPPGFSRDGFHASADGYLYYANHLLGFVVPDRRTDGSSPGAALPT